MVYLSFNTRLYIIVLILIFSICTSCRDSDTLLMNSCEHLIEEYPDSTLFLLESIEFPEDMSEENYARYCQLLLVAHQKNRISIKNDTLIHYAVRYYRNIPKYAKDYNYSLILLGNVYEEQDLISLAEECYLEVYDLTKNTNDSLGHGISAFELGGVYKYCEDYEKAIIWFNIAQQIFKGISNIPMQNRSIRHAGDCYLLSGRQDTALIIYNTLLDIIPSNKNRIRSDIYKNIAISYKKAKYYDKSLEFMQKSIECIPKESLYPLQYIVLASIYNEMDQKDSSLYYTQMALQYAKEQKDISLINKAYDALYKGGDHKQSYNYLLSKSISDSIFQKQKYESVYERLYNIEKLKKRNKDLKEEIKRFIFFSILIIVLIIITYLYQYNRKNRIQLQLEEEISHKNDIINAIKNTLYQRFYLYQKMVRLSISPNNDKYKSFLKEYNKILFGINEEFKFDWNIIYDFNENLFGKYLVKIKKSYLDITDIDEKIIVLLRLGFSASEIALILNKSIHTIYKSTSGIRKKLNVGNNDSIMNYLNNVGH